MDENEQIVLSNYATFTGETVQRKRIFITVHTVSVGVVVC